MSRRLAILLSLAAILLAASVYYYLHSKALHRSTAAAPALAISPPPPPEPLRLQWGSPKVVHQPNRFDQLDASFRALALQLENAAIEWWAQPHPETPNNSREIWKEESIRQISLLDTGQIAALANWMLYHPWTEAYDYRPALYIVWGSRDLPAARAQVLGRSHGLSKSDLTVRSYVDEVSDDFHHIRVGQGMTDPAGAWAAYLEDEQDGGDAHNLNDDHVTPPEIFICYARKEPGKVWELCLAATELYFYSMLEGFAEGASPGQDWAGLARQFLDSPKSALPNSCDFARILAARWAREDPHAALDWYSSHGSYETVFNSLAQPWHWKDGKAPVHADDPAGQALVLKLDLLDHLVIDPLHRHSANLAALLDRLIREDSPGDRELVRQALDRHSVDRYSYTGLLPLIPKLQDSATREDLLLKFIRHLPDYSREEGKALVTPNPGLALTRDLVSRLDLSPAAHAEITSILKRTEVLEEENRHALPAQ